MGSSKTAILAIRIIGDSTSAVDSMTKTGEKADTMGSTMTKAGVIAGGALLAIGAGAKHLEGIGEAADAADKRIANITNSMGLMGGQAAAVSGRLSKMAEDVAKKTGIDPNVIKQGEATLSTFDKIAASANQVGGVFDRATKASVDLSAAGFGSVESASTMLGKALNDPIKGLTALNRVGVQFTDDQKNQIQALVESGDTLKAQEIILKNVERQVGGTAEATADSADKQKVAWQLTQEQLGKKLIPVFEKYRDIVSGAAEWIGNHAELVIALGGALAVAAGAVLAITTAYKIFTAIQGIQTAFQLANNSAWLASPVTWIVLAIIAAIAALILIIVLVVKHWDQVRQAGEAVWLAIKLAASAAGDTFQRVFTAIGSWWNGLVNSWRAGFDALIGWIKTALDWLGRIAGSVMPGWLKDAMGIRSMSVFTPEPAVSRATRAMVYSAEETATAFGATPVAAASAAVPTLTTASFQTPPAGYVDNRSYDIHVDGVITDPEATARKIRQILDDSDRANGRKPAAVS